MESLKMSFEGCRFSLKIFILKLLNKTIGTAFTANFAEQLSISHITTIGSSLDVNRLYTGSRRDSLLPISPLAFFFFFFLGIGRLNGRKSRAKSAIAEVDSARMSCAVI